MTNEDVTDLFSRVNVGTRVVVLPKAAPHLEARTMAQARPAVTTLPSGRQAMSLTMSALY